MWASPFFGVFVCAAVAALALGEQPGERLVRTPQGPVRGYKQPGDSVYAFFGIPYATMPTGKFKFKAPLPAPAWLAPLEAVKSDITCPQAALKLNNETVFEINKATTEENCLVANVFVPETDQKKLPVVVYVHKGAYQIGFGNSAYYYNLVRSKKAIVVTFNYRLGIHGFLCLGTKDVPGNAGMKDQLALLRWVRKYIASYGGNPGDVTIAGLSAGASAVDLLMLSPAAKGLFNKVIPESGANLSPWSVQIDPIENAKAFAKSVGFNDVDDVYALEEFYMTATSDILNSGNRFWDKTDATFIFSPCVERETGEETFLTESPYIILRNGKYKKVPMLYGFAKMEGSMRLPYFDTWKNMMNANFSNFLPIDLQFESFEQREEVAKSIKEFYFGEKPVGEDNVLSYIDFITDVYYVYPALRAVNLHVDAGHNKIYLYEYNFVDESEPAVPHTNNVKGAQHGAQSRAVADEYGGQTPGDESTLSQDYKNVKAVMRDIWLNFITTGTPVPAGSSLPAWPPTGASGSPHMSLGRTPELRRAPPELRGAPLEQRWWLSVREPEAPVGGQAGSDEPAGTGVLKVKRQQLKA